MSQPSDQRVAHRTRVSIPARVLWREGSQLCVIRDLSLTGAKLSVSRKAVLPAEFTLCSLQTEKRQRVRMHWRRFDYAGVSFVYD